MADLSRPRLASPVGTARRIARAGRCNVNEGVDAFIDLRDAREVGLYQIDGCHGAGR